MFMVAAVLVVLGGAVLLAVTHVAPGRAPSFSTSIPQQVPDWPFRDPSNLATGGPSAAARPAAEVGPAQPQPKPNATIALPPTPSIRLSATPTPTCAVYPGCVTSSGGSAIFVEQAIEAITSLHRAVGNLYRVGRFAGPALPESLVWSSLMVVLKELLQHPLQVPPPKDQHVIERLATCSPHPAFREGVRHSGVR